MARDPDITLNVTTDQAVKNLTGLEAAAVDAEGKVEKLDGQTISIDPSDTTRAIDDLGKKLDDANTKASRAGKDGIPVTTNAFKDLTEGIGGPASGAIGSLFGFGETLEGLGDIAEGFAGRLGIPEEKVGKFTSALGTGLAVLGGLGVALTLGQAAFEAFGNGAKKAREEQKKTNEEIDKAAEALRGVAEALRKGERATAVRDILKDITPLLDDMGRYGLSAADAVREIMGEGKPFTDAVKQMGDEIGNFDGKGLQAYEDLQDLATAIGNKRDGVQRATEQDKIAAEVLGDLNTAITDQTEYLKDNTQKIEDRRQKQLDAIDTERDLETQLLDTKDALKQYDEKMQDANGDVDAQRRITIETAQQVVELAKSWGLLVGPEGSVENINRTRESLQFLYADLAPGSPLRTEIQKTIEDLARIGVGYQTGGPITGAALGAKEGGIGRATTNNTINVTVTSADPNAVVRALQTYVRQNGALPPSIR